MNPFAALFAFVFAGFLAWSLVLTSSDAERTQRLCTPVSWTGKLAKSITMVVAPTYAGNVEYAFVRGEKNCQFVVFQTFFQGEYERLQAKYGTSK